MRAVLATLLLLGATTAHAAEPSGCDKFKWPIARDQKALTGPERITVKSGGDLSPAEKPVTLTMVAAANAELPTPPERQFPPNTFAGYLKTAIPAAGSYTLSLSSAVWVDVVQDGRTLKPTAFSGATDCNGIRKSLKFDLAAQPATIQFSGNATDAMAVVLHPSD